MAKIEVIQRDDVFAGNLSEDNLIVYKKSQAKLLLALNMEESFRRQKAACHWLKEWERNTSYFHNLVKKNRGKRYTLVLLM